MTIEKERKTKETDIVLSLDVEGQGQGDIDTGIGFFDHMLESFAKHGTMNLKVRCKGDTYVDDHHSVEDVGIVLGQAFREAVFPIEGVERFGHAVVVMDEAAVECALDLSNRPYLVYALDVHDKVGQFDTELVEEFFKAFAFNAGITLHLVQRRGSNRHHIVEAAFKACAVALRHALAPNARTGVPSTKGIL